MTQKHTATKKVKRKASNIIHAVKPLAKKARLAPKRSTTLDSYVNITTRSSLNGKQGPSVVDIHDSDSDTGSNLGISNIEDSDDRDEVGKPVELNLNNKSQLAKTERVSKDWRSPVYAFYHPVPKITYIDERRCHEFKCAAGGCKYIIRRYLDTKDKSSTGNMVKHAKKCWGDEWVAASQCQNAAEARLRVTKPTASSGSITASFSQKGKAE